MAFAAAARRNLASRGLSGLLERRLRPSIHQLLPSNSTGEPRKPPPLPPQPAPRSLHFALAPCGCGTSQTLNYLPFGLHLLPGPPRRSFSSVSRGPDFTDVLTDAAHAGAAPASFPGEVAWAAEDSSTAVAAAQHLIDAVHSITGFNWWISIALSTVLLRCVVSTVWMLYLKSAYVMRQDLGHFGKLVKNAKDHASRGEAENAGRHITKKLRLLIILPHIATTYTFITLYSAISNMVEKVPSLNAGGAFWFTDLTTPDALCIFPMITSLFIMLRVELDRHAIRRCKECTRKKDRIKKVWRAISLLSMLWTTTLPQAISWSFVAWTSVGLVERRALRQPAVQAVLFGAPLELGLRCSSCAGLNRPTAKDSPSLVKEQEQPVPPKTGKYDSDKKSTKGG
ncbi:mitochondrial inner membrane protein OXA1-like isoform X2 [Lolium perenne]|uniref:mitochondrial inner membrane protein OXA1-like isoform X2 n=1 Tax=Lolium perenne TaxID=4522 RepID=UPI0021F61DD9|nr:mitochondrial inner membrane protein OXA1-like isoform X4 [Lolium perenne]